MTTANAEETAAKLTINPIANPIVEIANIRSIAALHHNTIAYKHAGPEPQMNDCRQNAVNPSGV